MKILTISNKTSTTVSISYNPQQSNTYNIETHNSIHNIPAGESISFRFGLGNWSRAHKQEIDSTVKLLTLPTHIEAFRPQPWQKKARRKGLFNHMMYVVIKE